MTPELQALLQRCEAGTASEADLVDAEALLREQESHWVELQTLLERSVHAEAGPLEIAQPVLEKITATDNWNLLVDALRNQLAGELGRVELVDDIIDALQLSHEPAWRSLLGALARGLRARAAGQDMTDRILEEISPDLEQQWCRAMETLQEGLRDEARGIDLAPAVLRAIGTAAAEISHGSSLFVGDPHPTTASGAAGQASVMGALAHGLRSEAKSVDLVNSVMDAIISETALHGVSEPILAEALLVLADGLHEASRGFDISNSVLGDLADDPLVEGQQDQQLVISMETMRQELLEQSRDLDVTDAVMDIVAPRDASLLDEALETLAAGLEAEALGVDVCASVMERIQPRDHLQLSLSAMVDGELDVAARRDLAQKLSGSPQARSMLSFYALLGQQIRDTLRVEGSLGSAPSLWDAVAQRLDLDSTPEEVAWTHLSEALVHGLRRDSTSVDLTERIMARVLPPEPVLPSSMPRPEESREFRPVVARPSVFRRIPAISMVFALLALVLVLNVKESPDVGDGESDKSPSTEPAFELAEVNQTEIEDLTVAGNSTVQVFQMEDGAPLVIFIEEADESDGVTL